jgi:hypothetical protein
LYALTLVAGAAVLCHAHQVAACSTLLSFAIDPKLREGDSESPAPFSGVTAFTRRISATRCEGNTCTQSTCGDHGQLELQFDAREDVTGPDAVGYRVVWLSGELPAAAHAALDGVKPLVQAGHVTLDVGWNEVTQLSGEVALVAVDHAGNESTQSEPVRVEWSGCTSYWDDPTCRSSHESPAAGAAAHGCTLASAMHTPPRPRLELWLWAGCLTSLAARRKRARR